MNGLKVIASGDTVDVVLPGAIEPQTMTFEGIGLEGDESAPIAVLCTDSEQITYPLGELRIEPDEDA